MTRYRLSVLIPARNEYYLDIDLLHETVVNVLANTSSKTQCVVVLDGYTDSWPKRPLPVNDRLTVIHHRQSIGQRAATNEAARIATGEYLMKLDAHCALDENFDEKLLATFEPHWTVVPAQYNLLAFNWRCAQCGNLHDQGPQPNRCEKCKGRRWQQQKVWIPRDGREGSDGKGGRRNTLTHSWRFDSTLTFQYWGGYAADERHAKKHNLQFRPETQQPIHDTMCLLGACWAIRRERYFELDICDEKFGSWGNQGVEVACKTWLSGGELKVNMNTWFAHFFRVGGLNFPYPDGGRKERAVARSKELFLKNQWPKQIYPLSWLIDRFSPVPDFDTPGNPTRALIDEAGIAFTRSRSTLLGLTSGSISGPDTGNTKPSSVLVSGSREQMSTNAVSTPGLHGTLGTTAEIVLPLADQLQVDRVAALPVLADGVVELEDISTNAAGKGFNQPSVKQSMGVSVLSAKANTSVTIAKSGSPNPAPCSSIDSNLGEDPSKLIDRQMVDGEVFLSSHDSVSETGLRSGPEPRVQRDSGPSIVTRKPRVGCLYYTCNSHDETLELACRNNLKRATNGHEIGVVALQRTDFGDWSIVIDQPKGPLTMHQQILAGLERSTADYVFFCENDVLYHPSHFEFVSPRDDVYYYNTNVWRVRYGDGFAIKTADCKQLSGLCASRSLLLKHYRARVERIAKEGFSRRNGYEPGTRKVRHGGYDDIEAVSWDSPFPNLDIKDHGATVTKGQWSVDDFRNKKFAEGWEESTGRIEPWPLFYGRLQEWLKELADGGYSDGK